MNIKEFYALIDSDANPDRAMLGDLQNLTRKFPFYQAGIFTYIKCLYVNDIDTFSIELQRLSPFVHDRKALFYYVMSDVYKQFYKEAPSKQIADRTDLLINAFFETHEDKEAESRLEHAIVNASMASFDYFSFIDSSHNIEKTVGQEKEIKDTLADSADILSEINKEATIEPGISESQPEGAVEMKHQSIIDSFINKAEEDAESLRIKLDPAKEPEEVVNANETDEADQELDDDFFFTQTLANIYIKQKKYQRAYEIIKRLSLNYPEKNIYFADQLSFLEKVIKNSNNK